MEKRITFTKEQTTEIMKVFVNEWNGFIRDFEQGCPFNRDERRVKTESALEALSKIPYSLYLVGDKWVQYIVPKIKNLEPLSLNDFIIKD